MSRYTTTVDNNNISLTIDKQEHTLSLSRTGGQGSKGDSVSNVVIDSNADLIITIVKADGTTYDINAGNLESTIDLGDLDDFEIVNEQQGDFLVYDSTASKFKNHQLTTSRVLDIDNTNKADGAVLVYDNTAQKYQATNRIEKSTTHIIGGSF
jgi:hypothetical protein